MSVSAFTRASSRISVIVVILFLEAASTGCHHYVTPGAGVSLDTLVNVDEDIAERLKRSPASPFPARMAVVRVQAPNYRSYRSEGYGHGTYSVVTTREIERDEHFDRIAHLPQVSGLAALNLLVIPSELKSDKELRLAAASVKADLLLLYSINTVFRVDGLELGPLQVIALGTLPSNEAKVTATASAAIMDVRTGYIYGLAESTAQASELASAWIMEHVVDHSRLKAETESFEKLLGEVEKTWAGVVQQYAAPVAMR